MIYVMWSPTTQQSKIGISCSPERRAQQIRRHRRDATIDLRCAWYVEAIGVLEDEIYLESTLHGAAKAYASQARAGVEQHLGEWYDLRWPTAVALVEQVAQLWSPLGLRIRRSVIS